MIRNANRNISVSKGHQYTVEKVKFAKDFINNAGRNTTLEDWVQAYNYIKGTNETAKGCQRCAAAKFTASVRNYAQYGYLTLINEGHTPDEFIDNPVIVENNVEGDKVEETTENDCFEEKQPNVVVEPALRVADVNIEQVEASQETCNEEKQVEELVEEEVVEVEQPVVEKPKRGRKPKKK